MRRLMIVGILGCLVQFCCTGHRTEGPAGAETSPGETRLDYVGVIETIEQIDAKWRFGVVVSRLLGSTDASLEKGAKLHFFVPRGRESASLTGAYGAVQRRIYRQQLKHVLEDEDAERVQQKIVEILSNTSVELPEALIGETVRVIYHDPFTDNYAGRLSVWPWPGSLGDLGTEFLGRLHHVRRVGEGGLNWWVEVTVTRVLLDHDSGLQKGSVVEFLWEGRFTGPSLVGELRMYEGMEDDFRDEFKVIYLDQFARQYAGFVSTSPW